MQKFFPGLCQCVPGNIPHQFSKAMQQKSVIVSPFLTTECSVIYIIIAWFIMTVYCLYCIGPLGVIPRNENKWDEMAEIMEQLQKQYCPVTDKDSSPVKMCRGQIHNVYIEVVLCLLQLQVLFGGDQLTAERGEKVPGVES